MNIIESFELETLHTKLKKNYNISLLLEHTMYIFISFSIFFLLFFQSLYHSKCFNTSFLSFCVKNFIKFKKLKRFLKLFLPRQTVVSFFLGGGCNFRGFSLSKSL